MKTLKQLSLGLFLVALSATTFAQTSESVTPILLPNGKVVMVEKPMDKYGENINDDEDSEELNIFDDSLIRNTCKSCYIDRSGESSSTVNGKAQMYLTPRRD
ncbi:MAG: hypothetical protein AAGC47_05695 [Bacteroidota bacterium]